jgi:hypothetical protein
MYKKSQTEARLKQMRQEIEVETAPRSRKDLSFYDHTCIVKDIFIEDDGAVLIIAQEKHKDRGVEIKLTIALSSLMELTRMATDEKLRCLDPEWDG